MTINPQSAPNTNASFLLEGDEPGLPLIISFGFYDGKAIPQFDFYGRLKKVALVSGRRMNRLYLQDPQQLWYLRGIRGLGDSVDTTITALRNIIDKLAPRSLTTIGQSMGAYGAILYGILLGADKTIAFGPLSCFDGARWQLIGDRRWEPIRQHLVANGPALAPYDDLAGMLRSMSGKRPAIDILYGMASDENGITPTIGHDVAHAMRFEGVDNVRLLPIPAAPHASGEYLRKNGAITEVLLRCLYGTPLDARIIELYQPVEWLSWLEENFARGSSESDLINAMRPQLSEAAIADIFNRLHFINALRTISTLTEPKAPVLMKAPYDPDEEEELHECCSNPHHQHR